MRLLGPPEVPGTAWQEAKVGAGFSASLDVGAVRPQTADVPSFPMTTRKRPPSLPPPSGPEGPGGSELLLYTTHDNQTRIEVRLEDETVWLSQAQMADLFQTTKQNVSLHIRNLFEEGELDRAGTVKDSLTVQSEGGREVRRQIEVYNLDVIISVGYRVKSHRGTQFRIWATQRLREYLVKGFALDDDRLKDVRTLPGGRDYFDELLERIRDIRSSERRFYQKVCDIYATSIDYDPAHEVTQAFFATVQNKLHWAIHGRTAAEVIAVRADATKPNMGLTTWKGAPGSPIRRADVEVAKNYLSETELRTLNLLVDQYLSFAEFQAQQRKPMAMKDWSPKLDDFLKLNERDILTDAGRISHELAMEKARGEFEKYDAERRRVEAAEPSEFDRAVEGIKKLTGPKKRAK